MKKRVLAVLLSLCMFSINTMGVIATSVEGDTAQISMEEAGEDGISEEDPKETEAEPEEIEEIADTAVESQEIIEADDSSDQDEEESDVEEEIVTTDDGDSESVSEPMEDYESIIAETDIIEKEDENTSTAVSVTEEITAADIEEINENAKNEKSEFLDSLIDESQAMKASKSQSAEENMNDLINYILTYGSDSDNGKRIIDGKLNDDGSDICSITVNQSKGVVNFAFYSSSDSAGLEVGAILFDYSIRSKTFGVVNAVFIFDNGDEYIAEAEINPLTYYYGQKLSFSKRSGPSIQWDLLNNLCNTFTDMGFLMLDTLLINKASTVFTWIGFPKYCPSHSWESEYTVDKQPTYTEEGYESIHCIFCDAIKEGSQRPIEKLTRTGWIKEDSGWKYYKADGTPATGWLNDGGTWYYMNEEGVMQNGWQKVNGIWYYMNGSGAMVTGWQSIGGKWYYFNGSGAMQTGWQKIGSVWYYFSGSGAMVTGWQSIGGKWYYFSSGGAMQTGWQKIGSTWYYFSSSGAMQTGWQKINNKWYYFKASGAMVTGRQQIDGKWYTFSSSGVMQ